MVSVLPTRVTVVCDRFDRRKTAQAPALPLQIEEFIVWAAAARGLQPTHRLLLVTLRLSAIYLGL